MKIIYRIFGHKWLWLEAIYRGELDGRWCERCGAEEGIRV